MVSRTERGCMTRGPVVWVALAAFCVCLLAPSAFPRSRPYDIKTVTHVKKDVDDGGWAGGGSMYQNTPERHQPLMFSFSTWLQFVVFGHFPGIQPKFLDTGSDVSPSTIPVESSNTTVSE